MSSKEKIFTYTGFALFLLAMAYFLFAFSSLDGKIPVHFNAAGEPDRFGSKTEAIIAFVVFGIVMIVLQAVKNMDPQYMNMPVKKTEENLSRLHTISKELLSFIILWSGVLSIYLSYEMVQIAKGLTSATNQTIFWGLILSLFLGIIYYFLTLRKNQ
ncbi:DUF1648 domain-containing protein [Jiulongibacter sp. NS-SX5]|uniref:DUF1648 domain-containing protein n=1 Tax=Jiulongibacter sp. NS-SX5 TaxID=3463854 RepID=UPI004059CC04